MTIQVTGPAPTVSQVVEGPGFAVRLVPDAGQQRDILRRLARAVCNAGLRDEFAIAGLNPGIRGRMAEDAILAGIDLPELLATVLNPGDAERFANDVTNAAADPGACVRCSNLVDVEVDPNLCVVCLADCEQDEAWDKDARWTA